MKKGFILGFATGLAVASASLVLANSQIQAILNNQIKVSLNGQVQEFRDEATNEIQYPITYKDRTYLPLRTVANLVGVGVDYDSTTNTAILSTSKANEQAESDDYTQVFTKTYDWEEYDIESILKDNGINIQQLNKGKYKYKVEKIKIGNEIFEGIISFNVSEYSYFTNSAHFYLIKDSKTIIDFSSNLWGDSSIENLGKFFIYNNYIFNLILGPDDICVLDVYDFNGSLILFDSKSVYNISLKSQNKKIIEEVYDEPAETKDGSFYYYKSTYEIFEENGKLTKKRISVDYNDIYRSSKV